MKFRNKNPFPRASRVQWTLPGYYLTGCYVDPPDNRNHTTVKRLRHHMRRSIRKSESISKLLQTYPRLSFTFCRVWTHQYYCYVYLTEPDDILHFKLVKM